MKIVFKSLGQIYSNKIFLTLLVLLTSLNLASYLVARNLEDQFLKREVESQLTGATQAIEDNIRENILALKRMGDRWSSAGGTSEQAWRTDARAYSRDLLGVVGTGYADASTKIKWIEPIETNSAAVNFRLNSEANRLEAINTAIRTRVPAMTKPINLKQDGMGFLIVYPVYKQKKLDGFVYLVGRYSDYFPKLLRTKGFLFSVSANNTSLYKPNGQLPLEVDKFAARSLSGLKDTADWTLEVLPTEEKIQSYHWKFTSWTILVSLFLSLVVIFISFLFEKSKRLSNSVKAQNAWKNTILNSTELVVISTDTRGVVVSFNLAAEKLLGYRANEIIGLQTPHLWHDAREVSQRVSLLSKEFGEPIPPGIEIFVTKAKRGLYDKSVWTFISKSGLRRQVFLTVNSLRDENQNIEGFVFIVEEVSDQLKLKEQVLEKEAAINNLVENAFDGFWDWDIKNDYEYMSPRFWKMFGYDPKEKRHHPSEWQKIISPEGLKIALGNFEKHVKTKGQHPFDQEVRYIHKDGHDVWVICRGKVTDWDADGSPLRMIGTHTDITELKKKSAAVKKAQDEIVEKDAKILELRQKSDEWFRVITDSLPQLMWTCQPDGQCDFLSEQWVKYTGIEEKRQLGFEWLKQIHPEDQIRVSAEWSKNVVRESVFAIKFRIRRHDGVYNWFETMAIPIKDSQGRIIRWLGSNTNIQEIYAAKEALEDVKTRLEIALEGSNIGIWDWDVVDNKLVWDDQMFEIYGVKRESFSNSYEAWAKCVHPEDLPKVQKEVEMALNDEKVFNTQFRVVREDGETTYVMGRAKVTRNKTGNPIKMIGINWNITKIKLNEIALGEAKAQAMQSSLAKAQFLANMSHEIRTPLNGIVGMTNLLKDTPLDSVQKEYLEHIAQSSSILLALINDILDLSKIESGKIELESIDFNLEQNIDFVLSTLSFSAKNKSLELVRDYQSPTPHWLKSDPSRLKQVLLNLVSNAIKFTNKGSVTVRTKALSQNNENLKFRIEVIDTGIGLTEEQKKKLFQNFSQADSSTHRKFGGTGLGLAISKLLVEKLGGMIGVDSIFGQGSVFWLELELPLGEEKLVPKDVPGLTSRSIDKKSIRILVAEDNLVNQKVAEATLLKLGYDCQVVSNGIEVLRILASIHFDLILMDCQMPEMDGFEATQRVRDSRDNAYNSIPIIAMTANAMSGDRERCLEVGMNDYVSKPVSAQDLSRTIEKWLSSPDGVDENTGFSTKQV